MPAPEREPRIEVEFAYSRIELAEKVLDLTEAGFQIVQVKQTPHASRYKSGVGYEIHYIDKPDWIA